MANVATQEDLHAHGHDHSHDHDEHHASDKYQMSFLTKYIFCLDHKMISKQFLVTGIFWGLIGAFMSVTPESLTAAAMLPGVAGQYPYPCAVVCKPCDEFLFVEHAKGCAKLGAVRAVFTQPEEAIAWCQERAAVARLVELSRMRRASPARLYT